MISIWDTYRDVKDYLVEMLKTSEDGVVKVNFRNLFIS